MPKTTRTITRKQLYEKVWSTPMTAISKEYGLSDVGMAKLCKRHDIPRPPRGYWAQVQHGQIQQALTLQHQQVQYSPSAAIAIVKRVNAFKLMVNQPHFEERIQRMFIGMDKTLQVVHMLLDRRSILRRHKYRVSRFVILQHGTWLMPNPFAAVFEYLKQGDQRTIGQQALLCPHLFKSVLQGLAVTRHLLGRWAYPFG